MDILRNLWFTFCYIFMNVMVGSCVLGGFDMLLNELPTKTGWMALLVGVAGIVFIGLGLGAFYVFGSVVASEWNRTEEEEEETEEEN